MRRYFKYIFLTLITVIFAASCIEEMESPQPMPQNDALTLVPRVKSFTNQYVTKAEGDEAAYTQAETKITHLAYLIFDSNGNLVKMDEADVQNGNGLTLNKTNLNSSETVATVVMFANVNLADIKKANSDGTFTSIGNTLTLEEFDDYSIHPTSDPVVLSADLSDSGFKGFPMKGIAQNVNLTTSSKDPIVVSLQILYAKINFDISVAAGTENQNYEGITPSFTLSGYSVTNVPTSTPVKTLNDDETLGDIESTPSGTIYEHTGTESDPSKTVSLNGTSASTFTFYMAESRYNHGGTDGVYPVGDLPEDVKQQYKPKLATNGTGLPSTGLATYVTINGKYKDYRGTEWTVNYKVYLGKNSYDDFHVDRNSEYKNFLTIKGIRNNDSYTDAGSVWIDHRVDVSTDDPSKHITITRETLIDSHIEVRPLRVSWSGTNYTFARVYMPYYTENSGETWSQRDETSSKKNWIGIELNDKTGSLYCSANNETTKGKRKYFTDALISELNTPSINTDIVAESGQDMFIALNNNECAWIYIDEYIHPESSSSIASADRRAKIVVDFCTVSSNGKLTVNASEEYLLYQQPLINIDNKYYVENYEEYLHSYDSHDNYNLETSPTDYTGQGLQWGKSNRMSKSQFVTKKLVSDWSDWAPTNNEAYDFLHATDAASESLSEFVFVDKDGNNVDLANNTGVNFTYHASANNGITISSMGEMPTSAYQYCLSKNKFIEGEDGESHKMKVNWYVPDVYELSDIFGSPESPLSTGCFYWSSQAPYDITQSNILSATIASERVAEARVVSNDGGIGTKPRSEKHRIRCLYTLNADEADMTNRTPEGIGGLIKIPMTVANDGFFNYTNWLKELEKDVTTKDYENKIYKFPKNDEFAAGTADRTAADKDFSGSIINGVHYYAKNPLTEWGGLGSSYAYIHEEKWPGLTEFEVVNITDDATLNAIANALGISSLCRLTETPKTDTKVITTRKGKKIDKLPTNDQLATVPLDHNEDTENTMTISFDIGKNKINSPAYQYHKENPEDAVVKTYTKYWTVPEYSHKSIPGGDVSSYPCPEESPVYDEAEIKDDILDDTYRDGRNTKRRKVVEGSLELNNDKTAYLYASYSDAYRAAEKYFEEVININNEYKYETVLGQVTNPKISVDSKEILIATYDWTGETRSGNLISGYKWNSNGESGQDREYKDTRYTWTMTCEKKDGTYYKYVSGTGGWSDQPKTEEKTGAEAALESIDALTFFTGNTFTIKTNITKDSQGNQYKHYIRSVKVNYNTSTITDGEVYLRFVSGATYLPANNVEPEQMTYLDGDNGWSKWTSNGNDETVTLRLVIYNKSDAGILNWWNPPFSHTDPAYSGVFQNEDTEFKYQLIINSLEIRLEDVPLQTN